MRSETIDMPDATLVIEDLHVAVADKQILRGVDLTVEPGRVHALMGPNGSGKSTLAYALAGHPGYRITGGKVSFKGEDLLGLTPDERARLGMFLAMQYPVEVPGVSVTNFLRTASARSSPSSTRPTPAWTSTPCGSSPTASTSCAARGSASC